MKNTTQLLPGFHLPTLRRKPKTTAQKLAEQLVKIKKHSINQLSDFFSEFIPFDALKNNNKGSFSRKRLFSKTNTFWTFFSQVLDSDSGCSEAVRRIQSYCSKKSNIIPSTSTSAYCQARKKLNKGGLKTILKSTGEIFQDEQINWNGHRVVVVDGTGLSMPDTEANQLEFPQLKTQKPGCSFPQARVLACFNLHTGALLSHEIGNKKSHELPLLRKQIDTFKKGDVFLGDKGFCSYYDVNKLQQNGVNSVITLARRLPKTATTACKVLGENDLLIKWEKPKYYQSKSYTKEDWVEQVGELKLRQIKVVIDKPGYRVSSFYIVTTLIDSDVYSAKDIADLYFQRWDVELFFRDIKTTMGMDILRCLSPEMVKKEILMHLIVYNCIRLLMVRASEKSKTPVRLISFKASIQALRHWQALLVNCYNEKSEIIRLKDSLIIVIADAKIFQRPNRREPRCIKRRLKSYQLLTMHRGQMIETPHKGRKFAKKA